MNTYPFCGSSGVAPVGGLALGGAATVELGAGAGLDRLGRAVGKSGSVGEFGLVTGVPSMPEWQPTSSPPVDSRHPSSNRAFITQIFHRETDENVVGTPVLRHLRRSRR
jgi:hypothetical protein